MLGPWSLAMSSSLLPYVAFSPLRYPEQVSVLLHTFEDITHLEHERARVARVDGLLELGPHEWRGHGGTLLRPHRVHARHRLVLGVLAPVHEHLARAERPGHARDDGVGPLALEQLGDRLSGGLGVRVGQVILDR